MDALPRYIFIVGLPRTGSKLIVNVLSGIEAGEYRATPENFFLGRSFLPGVRRRLSRYGDLSVDSHLAQLVEDMFNGAFHGDFWDRLRDGRLDVEKEWVYQQLKASDRSDRAIYKVILHCHARGVENVIYGDKTGPHLYHVPTLLSWFPDAKIIHTFRDPRAILASEHKKRTEQWDRRADKAASDGKDMQATVVRWTRPLISLAVLFYITFAWLRAAHLHQQYKRRFPKNYTLSKFEDVVSAPDQSVQALCEFLGVPFSADMLNPPKVDSSFGRSKSSGFDVQTLARWQQTLQPWMQRWMSLWGQYYLKKFGYAK